MKKIFILLLIMSFSLVYAQESTVTASKGGYAEVPAAKRPKAMDKEKAQAAAAKDDSPEDDEKKRQTIRYGMSSEISGLLDDLIKNDDPRYTEEIYDLFQTTKNPVIKEKVLNYFAKIEDPCLEDFAVDLLNDPYDEKGDVVRATFQYVSAVKTKAAIPAVITLIEGENENYFNDAISCLGYIGGPEEAMFLAEYLDREDLSVAQRQTLMRVCGKMHAEETWGRLVDIIENDDENVFVRMYAAESIGMMKLDKSVPVLTRNFGATDPNLRQYIIKGIKNYPGNSEAENIIMQGIKDDHWRVRQESIRAAKEMKLTSAVPFLIYRAKNDSEKVIKNECLDSIAVLNTDEGNKFLIGQLQDKKVSDAEKGKIVEVLLREGKAGEKEILELADSVVNDDKRKTLRYTIGKELAKYDNASFAPICQKYLSSKDPQTQSLGLDMYKKGKYSSAKVNVEAITLDKKANAGNKKRAEKILGITEPVDAK